jgi:iron-sulfur cluster repair protein YtfE (RIC family)
MPLPNGGGRAICDAMTDLTLPNRTGLPDALRALLDDIPRDAWESHPRFEGLVRFWLERHMMFRQLLDLMGQEAESVLDKGGDPRRFVQATSHYGRIFVGQMHEHHHIEDEHYFPILRGLDTRIAPGFDILDRDHLALDGHLARFVSDSNAVIRALESRDPSGANARFRDGLNDLHRMIERHLTDEEDLIVPVILRYGAGGLG